MKLARAIFIFLFLGALSAQASDRFFLEMLCVEDDAGVHHAETVNLWVNEQPLAYQAHGLRLSVAAHLEPDRTLVIDHRLLDKVNGYRALSPATMKIAPGSPPPAYSFAIKERKFSVIIKGAMVPKPAEAPPQAAEEAAPAEPPAPEAKPEAKAPEPKPEKAEEPEKQEEPKVAPDKAEAPAPKPEEPTKPAAKAEEPKPEPEAKPEAKPQAEVEAPAKPAPAEPAAKAEEPSPEPEAPKPAAEAPPAEDEPEEDEGYELSLEEAQELLQAMPSDSSGHKAVYRMLGEDHKALINFYRGLVKYDADENAHTLSLARAYVYTDKHAVAVVQYQKYLRAEPSKEVYLELADTYDHLGKKPLADDARRRAEAH
ncbi:MAG: hypothetical protein KC910_21920 [Candidatus Eremiobacteraeota bacterium]|nr:hypothetical protein [Candidatus Eremiobacteraeota bacterium]